ncbi:MAG: hypothetical protein QOH66_1763, partial [Actinomycetota bacterium]|nr:hypothetical protein [Actinomycetota bacterium]
MHFRLTYSLSEFFVTYPDAGRINIALANTSSLTVRSPEQEDIATGSLPPAAIATYATRISVDSTIENEFRALAALQQDKADGA